MKKVFLLTGFILFIGCQKKSHVNNLENYEISLPNTWKVLPLKGIDSNIYVIITKNGDSIFSDFGRYSQKFKDNIRVFSKKEIIKYNSMGMNTKNFIVSDDPEIDQSQGTFLKEYYYYDTIDNLCAKIKVPKIYGNGQLGIHFDGIGINSLTIYANSLNEEEQKELLGSFQTITFK